MPTKVRVTFKNPRDARLVADRIRAELVQRIAQATIDRTIKRTGPHPSITRMRVSGVNQNAATISGVPGPGVIKPVRAQALRFNPGGGVIFRKSARYVGLEPLLAAEAGRVTENDINTSTINPT